MTNPTLPNADELEVVALISAQAQIDAGRRELSAVSAAIGSVRWMDPPDGGSVSLAEQVRRMREDLEAAEAEVKLLREAGSPLATMAFNLSQASSPLTDDHKQMLKSAVDAWDTTLSGGTSNG